MAGNGPSIGLTLLLFHIRSLCHLINTAMHPHHDTVGPAPSQESCESPSSHSANSCLNCNGEFKCVSACRIASLKTHHNHQNDTTEIYAHGESETLPVQEEDLQSSISGIFSSGAQGRKMPCDFEPMSVAAAMGGILFAFLGSYYFYVTGHQLAIASIRFETGFIGWCSLVETSYFCNVVLKFIKSFYYATNFVKVTFCPYIKCTEVPKSLISNLKSQ